MSRQLPTVSIVTPTFNSEDYLGDLLELVDAQTYHKIEHVIVDGASTDGTVDLIKSYAETHDAIWVSEPDEGAADATARGLRMATGEIVVIVPSDDLIFPWTIQTVVDSFLADPNLDVVHGDSITWDEGSDTWHLRLNKRFTFGYMARTEIILPQATYMKKEVVEGITLDTSLRHANDYDFVLQVTRGRKVKNIPEFLAVFRKRQGAINLQPGADTRIREEVDIVRSRFIRTSGPGHWLLTKWDRLYGGVHRRMQLIRIEALSNRAAKNPVGLREGTPWHHFLGSYSVSGGSPRSRLATLLPGRRSYRVEIKSRATAENLGAAHR